MSPPSDNSLSNSGGSGLERGLRDPQAEARVFKPGYDCAEYRGGAKMCKLSPIVLLFASLALMGQARADRFTPATYPRPRFAFNGPGAMARSPTGPPVRPRLRPGAYLKNLVLSPLAGAATGAVKAGNLVDAALMGRLFHKVRPWDRQLTHTLLSFATSIPSNAAALVVGAPAGSLWGIGHALKGSMQPRVRLKEYYDRHFIDQFAFDKR